jgi:hypothetical protein
MTACRQIPANVRSGKRIHSYAARSLVEVSAPRSSGLCPDSDVRGSAIPPASKCEKERALCA